MDDQLPQSISLGTFTEADLMMVWYEEIQRFALVVSFKLSSLRGRCWCMAWGKLKQRHLLFLVGPADQREVLHHVAPKSDATTSCTPCVATPPQAPPYSFDGDQQLSVAELYRRVMQKYTTLAQLPKTNFSTSWSLVEVGGGAPWCAYASVGFKLGIAMSMFSSFGINMVW